MASIDPRFICTSDVDSFFIDNASGLPMSGGIVTFYSDVDRTVLKPVYQLTGTPGNYSYAPLQNPLVLSSSGTYQDGLGNNIVPYYYPFTETPDDDTGVQELYYITCVNSGLAPQFVRQGWPQAAGSATPPVSDAEVENFIPNGQFLAHNAIISITEPPITTYTFGSETVDAQAIAQGGWYFVYTDANSAVFSNSFQEIPTSGGWNMDSFPKFIFNFVCSQFNANALTRDLRIQWQDANKFSSGNPPGSSPYTLFFDAKSNDGNSYTFTLYRIYYYGTGGSPSAPVVTPVATFTVGPSMSFVSHNIQGITFPANQGQLGNNGDDYVALSIRGPASAWNVAFSDFALVAGTQELTSFPVETNADMMSRGVAGFLPVPSPSGSDLYLPVVVTPQGMAYDHSEVGSIVARMTSTAVNNELPCNGSSYITSAYSSLGIPYSRLQSILLQNGTNALPLFGTGQGNSQAYISSGATTQLVLCTNIAGAQTHPSNGSTSPGFSYSAIDPGSAGQGYRAGANGNAVITFIAGFTGATNGNASFADGSNPTGMTFADLSSPAATTGYYAAKTTALQASSLAAGAGMPGLYFTYSNASTNYYMWFQVSTETDPAPGGTPIKVILESTMNANDVANIISCTIQGFQTDVITCVAATHPIPAGSWFTYYSGSAPSLYVVWYTVGGSGSQPSVGGAAYYVPVALAGTETAAQVAALTQAAINGFSFAVPDLRGAFLRGVDKTSLPWDLDYASRFGPIFSAGSNFLPSLSPGSMEFDVFSQHSHPGSTVNVKAGTDYTRGSNQPAYNSANGSTTNLLSLAAQGGTETRPVNMAVNYFIKY